MKRRHTVVLSEEAAAKAEQQAAEAGWTVAQWIAWLVEDYVPAQEVSADE